MTGMNKSVFTGRYAQFLELLRKAREETDLTWTEVAKALCHPQSFVSKCEPGERRVEADLARALGQAEPGQAASLP
jgi:hypothetical protein